MKRIRKEHLILSGSFIGLLAIASALLGSRDSACNGELTWHKNRTIAVCQTSPTTVRVTAADGRSIEVEACKIGQIYPLSENVIAVSRIEHSVAVQDRYDFRTGVKGGPHYFTIPVSNLPDTCPPA